MYTYISVDVASSSCNKHFKMNKQKGKPFETSTSTHVQSVNFMKVEFFLKGKVFLWGEGW